MKASTDQPVNEQTVRQPTCAFFEVDLHFRNMRYLFGKQLHLYEMRCTKQPR